MLWERNPCVGRISERSCAGVACSPNRYPKNNFSDLRQSLNPSGAQRTGDVLQEIKNKRKTRQDDAPSPAGPCLLTHLGSPRHRCKLLESCRSSESPGDRAGRVESHEHGGARSRDGAKGQGWEEEEEDEQPRVVGHLTRLRGTARLNRKVRRI